MNVLASRSTETIGRYCARALAVALIVASLCTAPLYSQSPVTSSSTSGSATSDDSSNTPTFKKDVKVVNVFATVRDKHGQIVPSLAKDDFTLQVDGRPETIRYFARETDLPLTIGLLVDTSLSQRRVLEEERTASYAFLNDVMREDRDKAFVINFDSESVLLQDLTSSKQKLETALDRVHVAEPDQNGGQGGGGNGGGGGYPGGGGGGHRGGGGHHAAGTTLYDAVFLASDELMHKQQGRKAIILLTDGVDQGSKYSLDRAIEAAQRSDTMVYSILFSDPEAYNRGMGPGGGYPGGHHGGWNGPWGGPSGPPMGGPRYPPQMESHADGKKVLQRLSRETGGHFFEVTKKESVEAIYKQVQDELRNQYSLGFSPETAEQSTGYHKILLAAKPKDLVVQTRQGYYEAP
ncbi:MAG: VWA domain-containing protein [Candidatus Korobacteraceae bacterium]